MATTGMPNETWRGAVVPVSNVTLKATKLVALDWPIFKPHLIILIFAEVSPCFTMFHHVSPFPGGPKLDPCFPDVSYVVPCVEGRLHMQTDPTARFVGAAPPTGGCVAIKAQIRFVVAWENCEPRN